MTKSLTVWREGHRRQAIVGTALQKLGEDLNLPEGFEVRTDYPQLNLITAAPRLQKGEVNSIPHFRRMVESVSLVLGAPEEVSANPSYYAWNNSAPDLVAEWHRDIKIGEDQSTTSVNIRVVLMSPRGCKIKPGTEFSKGTKAEMHPECIHAIAELEDTV